jgi:hypothetical protein
MSDPVPPSGSSVPFDPLEPTDLGELVPGRGDSRVEELLVDQDVGAGSFAGASVLTPMGQVASARQFGSSSHWQTTKARKRVKATLLAGIGIGVSALAAALLISAIG